VTSWALDFARDGETESQLIEGLARLLVAAGVPLVRVSSSFRPIDPVVWARNVSWAADEGVVVHDRQHGPNGAPWLIGSSVEAIYAGSPAIRERLDHGSKFLPIEALVRQGATDYLIQPIELGRGLRSFVSYATSRAGGFTAEELALLDEIHAAVGNAVRLRSTRLTAGSLLRTYLGSNAAERRATAPLPAASLAWASRSTSARSSTATLAHATGSTSR
jgi:adenylate cyclase